MEKDFNYLYILMPRHAKKRQVFSLTYSALKGDEITYPFSNFNGGTDDVWELVNYFPLHLIMDVVLIHAAI